jgi:hypothetical protein
LRSTFITFFFSEPSGPLGYLRDHAVLDDDLLGDDAAVVDELAVVQVPAGAVEALRGFFGGACGTRAFPLLRSLTRPIVSL